jgi:glycerol-3-phosphate dehydrogenase
VGDGVFDVFVIGGGINGCGIARDAAGRGYSVCLAEMAIWRAEPRPGPPS